MSIKRIYDPAVEEIAAMFPRLDASDPLGSRATLRSFVKIKYRN